MFLIWKHILWETLFSSYQKVAFEKKKLKSLGEEAHGILRVGASHWCLPFFLFFGLMAPFSCFLPLSWFFPSFPSTTVFFLLSLTSQRLHITWVSPQKNSDTFTFPKESKQTTIPKSCFIVENRIPKSYWILSSVILFVGYTWPSTHWKRETIFLNYT